ncbi:hypothetical protein Q31b_30820 [Novipirellula aureliae]|uniref:Uncharacterized protein n=1 Tax=Novipirellula aureliae TaxID=2527966 RepID=A0A5C6DYC8_9BACT|nr:hypothetical protein Q31b_30820 [Novipirellula aureliae]
MAIAKARSESTRSLRSRQLANVKYHPEKAGFCESRGSSFFRRQRTPPMSLRVPSWTASMRESSRCQVCVFLQSTIGCTRNRSYGSQRPACPDSMQTTGCVLNRLACRGAGTSGTAASQNILVFLTHLSESTCDVIVVWIIRFGPPRANEWVSLKRYLFLQRLARERLIDGPGRS